MDIKPVLGDYNQFFESTLENLRRFGIHTENYPVSHLGFKAKSVAEYEDVRNKLMTVAESMVENIHNGRPIAKIVLSKPLILADGFTVSLMEIMPPKNSKAQKDGLEHVGFVVGEDFEEFKKQFINVLTGTQDQGPYCQPAYIVFDDDTRVKFYDKGLKEVVELEDNVFNPIKQA